MKRIIVYDLPTRLFHWMFAGLFLIAFVLAKTVDDGSAWFSFHSLVGIMLSFLVLLRLIWGFIGTEHARFSGFALRPMDLVQYFKGILTGKKQRWAGHNPASSWAGLIMIFLAAALGTTGYLMTSGPNKEIFEDAHELFANAFIAVVAMHVAGIIIHTFRHREMIGMSMIDGKKIDLSPEQGISSSKTAVGVLMMGLILSFGLYLFENYNQESRSLNLFGAKLQLGETETETETE